MQYFPDQDSKRYLENEITPLIEYIEENTLALKGEVLRVHKRFLNDDEEIENGHSRLLDLFRVVYAVNPSEAILKQVEENPEVFKQLGEQVLASLHNPVESFIDFDLVIEATGGAKKMRLMGPSGVAAINELNLKNQAPFYYEKEIFSKFKIADQKTIILVGEGPYSELALMKLTNWLFQKPDHRLYWIRHSTSDVSALHLQKVSEKEFLKETKNFEEKIRQWRELDDFIKVKTPAPPEPMKKLMIYSGFNITSVDKLLDQPGVFITIESPDFRKNKSADTDLKTFSADAVLISQGFFNKSILKDGMREHEPGYYELDDLYKIPEIEKDILNYFSKENQ